MSGVSHPTDSHDDPWNCPPVSQLRSMGGLSQSPSNATWLPTVLSLPQPQAQYAPIYGPRPHLFSTIGMPGARTDGASISGNTYSTPALAPLTASGDPNAAQRSGSFESPSQTYRGNLASSINREDVDRNSSQRPSRRPRTRQPDDGQWQQNKAHIEELYMKKKLPLPEVVQLMKSKHRFSATEKMYKNKFKLWRWSKNLPQRKAVWMAAKIEQRRPKKTVFNWNNQEWTEETVAQKLGQASHNHPVDGMPVVCVPSPNDIDYKTPAAVAESPRNTSSWTAAPQSRDSRSKRNELPRFFLNTTPSSLDLSRTTISGLGELLKEASHAASAGRIDEADADFRDAVCGFCSLLSPTHEETLRAGYLYASFCANSANMDKAEAVLNWMSEKHIERWSSRHEKTYLHYARMVELFRCWGRQERAEILVYKIMDDANDEGHEALLNFPGAPLQRQRLLANIDPKQSFPETGDPEVMSRQLDKLELAIMTDITGFDNVLEVIVKHCEDKPDDMGLSLQACRAKCALAKLHSTAGRDEIARQALAGARTPLAPLLLVREEHMSRATTKTAIRLSLLFFEAKDEPSCNAVLDKVIASLESRRHTPSWERELDDAFLLDFVLEIAFHFHDAASWDTCRYWVERGPEIPEDIAQRRLQHANLDRFPRFDEVLRRLF